MKVSANYFISFAEEEETFFVGYRSHPHCFESPVTHAVLPPKLALKAIGKVSLLSSLPGFSSLTSHSFSFLVSGFDSQD
jgi:hypothetical protein